MTKQELYKAALAADEAFQAELVRVFGKRNAGDARYDARGKSTQVLRDLLNAKVAADQAFLGVR